MSNRKGNRTIDVKIERAESQGPEENSDLFGVWTCEPQKNNRGWGGRRCDLSDWRESINKFKVVSTIKTTPVLRTSCSESIVLIRRLCCQSFVALQL